MLKFTYKKKTAQAEVANGEHVTLWAVSTDYSEDGLFLAVWANSELESVPACEEPMLLATLTVNDQGEIVEEYKAKGVSYAKN